MLAWWPSPSIMAAHAQTGLAVTQWEMKSGTAVFRLHPLAHWIYYKPDLVLVQTQGRLGDGSFPNTDDGDTAETLVSVNHLMQLSDWDFNEVWIISDCKTEVKILLTNICTHSSFSVLIKFQAMFCFLVRWEDKVRNPTMLDSYAELVLNNGLQMNNRFRLCVSIFCILITGRTMSRIWKLITWRA